MGKKQRQRLPREHPRYGRVTGRPSVRQVMPRVTATFEVEVAIFKKGRRGEATQVRNAARYLGKRPCDLTLKETATLPGLGR